jgi:hypothetical protein
VSLILPWVLFPLVLAAIGAGWGVLVERAAGSRVNDALLLPVGLAAALVVAGTVAAFKATAPAAVTLVAVGAVAGLILSWPGGRLGRWPLLAALGVLLVYGAPVLLSGQATFTGFIKLDDTSTWFDITDRVMSHARSSAGLPPSTYALEFSAQAAPNYPFGAFMLSGVGRALVGVDIAWVFQPYMACCGAAVALSLYSLMEPLVSSARVRALLAFVAAQSALLYGYSLWGGSKELTAAFLVALTAALAAPLLPRRPEHWRALIPLALAAGALIQTFGVGAGGWVAPALLLLGAAWLALERRPRRLRADAVSIAWLGALTAAAIVPVWLVIANVISNQNNFFKGLFSSGQTTADKLGNLIKPLSAFQLAGIWPVGDFRVVAPAFPTALLIGLALIAAVAAVVLSIRRRELGLVFYLAVALLGAGAVYFGGGTPWVTGKALAVSSPAVLAAALTGGWMLGGVSHRRRVTAAVRIVVVGVLAGGVLWGTALAYHDATLAPRNALAEMQHIGKLVEGKGLTFINSYEIYADRHFLREGAPVEPAEYRSVTLPLRDGVTLTKGAWADLDSFEPATLESYRSIVTRRSPTESRPPSIYQLVYQGRFYQLWQRPEPPERRILEHIPLGESNALPYCGASSSERIEPLCSVNPVAVPPCKQVHTLARQALRENAELVAYSRPAPIVARADQTQWPAGWFHELPSHSLTPTRPGSLVGHIAVASSQKYELWLGGSFGRGFEVSVDGHHLGKIKDQLASFNGYVLVADIYLTAGVHTFTLTYPHADLTPGSGANEFTTLSAIALQPTSPPSQMIEVAPRQAAQLCGRSLDWIELVSPV